MIDFIYQAGTERTYEIRVKVINKIITHNKDPNAQLDDEVNLKIAKAALGVTNAKREDILHPKAIRETKFPQVSKSMTFWINALKQEALENNIDIYDTAAATLALKDVILLLAYMYKFYEIIIRKGEPLDEQMKNIVLTDKAGDMLKTTEDMLSSYRNIASPGKLPNVVYDQDAKCCQIFIVRTIIYDNPLLNKPTLIKVVMEETGSLASALAICQDLVKL